MDTLTDPPISSLFHLVVKLRYYHHFVGAPYRVNEVRDFAATKKHPPEANFITSPPDFVDLISLITFLTDTRLNAQTSHNVMKGARMLNDEDHLLLPIKIKPSGGFTSKSTGL